ncbi:MAG: DUF4097 family beta strand repeat protein [Bdellovibrionales bacterium]|nr:DUF4097 family beta strand repeat protein [Bdellovibrionales bacterium]
MWLVFMIMASFVSAETLNYKPLVFDESEIKEIHIQGYQGDITVSGARSATSNIEIQVKKITGQNASEEQKEAFDNWIFSYKNQDGILKLFIKESFDKEIVTSQLGKMATFLPKFNIQLSGLSKPITIHWRVGDLTVNSWRAPLKVVQQNGRLNFSELSGDTSVFLYQGQIHLNKLRGNVNLESYNAKCFVTDYEGNMKVESFSGKVTLNRIAGSLSLTKQSGSVEILEGKGQVDLDNGSASVILKRFSGDIRGKTDSGRVTADLTGAANLRLSSVDGDVIVSAARSAANINVGSKKGQLSGPNYLRRDQWSSLKTMMGQLRGNEQGGRVFVRSESGNIRIQ